MIPPQLVFTGTNKEFQFRDQFMMPLLVRLGFGIVMNYHGTREFGRDLVFGEIDRFGHVVYYGMQIKYESSIGLEDSHGLIQDAEQATHNPFQHPQTGRSEFISMFFVASAGDISEAARTNFFSTVIRRGVRDARLLDGNALLLLDRASALNRSANVKERLIGLLQEVRRNLNLFPDLLVKLEAMVNSPSDEKTPLPGVRCRNEAVSAYLTAPFPLEGVPIDLVDQYYEQVRIINACADWAGVPLAAGDFRKNRVGAIRSMAVEFLARGRMIDRGALAMLAKLGEKIE